MKKIGMILFLLFIAAGCGNKRKEIKNETKKEQTGVIGVSDMKIEEEIEFEIENKAEGLSYVGYVIIYFYDKEGQELEKMDVKVAETMGIGDKKKIKAKIKTEKKKISSYKYEVIR